MQAASTTTIMTSPSPKRIKLERSPSPILGAAPRSAIDISDGEAEEEDQCSICLQPIIDRTVIPTCSHEFCFECLLVWTAQSRRCPLCSQDIGEYLIHHIRSKYDFQKHYLAPLRIPPGSHSLEVRAIRATAIRRTQARRQREWGRNHRRVQDEVDELERAISKRRWVYTHGLYAKHVASNPYTRYRPFPAPPQFAASPDLISRATVFIRRELRVWDALDVEFLTTFTIALMKSIDIRSESAVKLLAEFLDLDNPDGKRDNAEHFAHELYCYLRSPYRDLSVYDTLVQYDAPEHIPPPVEHERSRRWAQSRSRSRSRHPRSAERSRSPDLPHPPSDYHPRPPSWPPANETGQSRSRHHSHIRYNGHRSERSWDRTTHSHQFDTRTGRDREHYAGSFRGDSQKLGRSREHARPYLGPTINCNDQVVVTDHDHLPGDESPIIDQDRDRRAAKGKQRADASPPSGARGRERPVENSNNQEHMQLDMLRSQGRGPDCIDVHTRNTTAPADISEELPVRDTSRANLRVRNLTLRESVQAHLAGDSSRRSIPVARNKDLDAEVQLPMLRGPHIDEMTSYLADSSNEFVATPVQQQPGIARMSAPEIMSRARARLAKRTDPIGHNAGQADAATATLSRPHVTSRPEGGYVAEPGNDTGSDSEVVRAKRVLEDPSNSSISTLPDSTITSASLNRTSPVSTNLRTKLLTKLEDERRVHINSKMRYVSSEDASAQVARGSPSAPHTPPRGSPVSMELDGLNGLTSPSMDPTSAERAAAKEARLRSKARLRMRLATAKRAADSRREHDEDVRVEDEVSREISLRQKLGQRRA